MLRSVWLAHAGDTSVARCLHLPVGRWRIALCARCAALYPTLLLVLALQVLLRARLGPHPTADAVLALGGAFPALLDWSRARLGAPSPRATRLWSGALLGLALGRTIFLHWRDPPGELLAIQLALLAAGAAGTLLLARKQARSSASRLFLG
ncbi:MAG: DUF2085 domain-containing protein [Proteobacteria bacterium]|nr:DUF2085 domain-containing protein [Pseudomonadota bacterium]